MANFEIVVDNSEEFLNALQENATRALEAACMQAESYAKLELDNDPRRIDTGLLRNSITHAHAGKGAAIHSYKGDNPSRYKNDGHIPSGSYSGQAPGDTPEDRKAWVGTNVEYAIHVHEGGNTPSGKRMTPNRFLKNAFEKNINVLKQIVETYLRA